METVVSGKLYRSSYRQIIGIKEYVRLFTERIFHFNLNQTIEYASKLFRWEDGGRVRRGHTAQDETKRCTNPLQTGLLYYYIPSVSTALQLEMAEKALRRLYSN